MARKRIYKFTEKTHSKRGIIASIMALVLLAVYSGVLYLAYKGDGGLNMYFGSIGVIAMILSVVTFVLSLTTIKEENSFQFFPRLAIISSFLASVGWIGTYVIGFMA